MTKATYEQLDAFAKTHNKNETITNNFQEYLYYLNDIKDIVDSSYIEQFFDDMFNVIWQCDTDNHAKAGTWQLIMETHEQAINIIFESPQAGEKPEEAFYISWEPKREGVNFISNKIDITLNE